jgi:DNA-directed RNA polymerase III subunit RPC7
LAKLKDLENVDDEKSEVKEGEDGDDGNEDEVVYEEEELEDETDYNLTYFDNGEEYGDYDDGDEGPVY